jgi:hypothetical protein
MVTYAEKREYMLTGEGGRGRLMLHRPAIFFVTTMFPMLVQYLAHNEN